jgi:membrane carboxypeptidase/penicillin-binding protein PbpC
LLTKQEQLVLLTLIKNPTKYQKDTQPKAFQERYQMLFSHLQGASFFLKDEEISIPRTPFPSREFPFLEDFYRSKLQQGRVLTTIDIPLQKKVEKIGEETLNDLASKKVEDLAILIVDRKTYQVKALV